MYNDLYLNKEDLEDYKNYLAQMNSQDEDISIDQDDLIIIENPAQWDPPYEIVIEYARKLKFDILNDPPELLSIAKKYLLMPLPDNMQRAFLKDNLQILYLDVETKVMYEDNDLDKQCRNEYEIEKMKLAMKKEEKKDEKKKKKKKKKSKKKSNKNSSSDIINNEDHKNKINNDKEHDEQDKINLLNKKKLKIKEYKEIGKKKYIKDKIEFIQMVNDEYYKKIISEKNKLKTDQNNNQIKPKETQLQQNYDNIISKYKEELKEKYETEIKNDSLLLEQNNKINNLNIKIKNIQNEINKLKEIKKEKIKEELEKREKDIHNKKNEINIKLKKKSDILKNNFEQKIQIYQNDLNKKFESYKENYEFYYIKNQNKYNKYNINNKNINDDDFETKKSLMLNEINELFEVNKINLEKEFEEKLNKDLILYEKELISENKKKSENYKNEIINMEKKYQKEIEDIKNNKNENNIINIYLKECDKINKNIGTIYTINIMHKGIDNFYEKLKKIKGEENIEDFINEKYNELHFKLIGIKSSYYITEKDYLKNFYSIEYYKEILLLLIKNILHNNNNNNINDLLLINDLIIKIEPLIEKYSKKYKDNINKKLFIMLENKYNEIINNKNISNNNSILFKKSFYEQSSKNAINTTIIIDNFKNAIFNNSKKNKNKNLNQTYINNQTNQNLHTFRNNFNNNYNNDNNKFINSARNFRTKNFLQNNNNINNKMNDFSKYDETFVNINSKDINNNNNSNNYYFLKNKKDEKKGNIKEEKYDVNTELTNILKLNEDIKKNLSEENLELYNKIMKFFYEEYNSLNEKIKSLNNNHYINNQIKSLRESAHLNRYKNIFDDIYLQEKKKSENIEINLLKSKNHLDKITKECNSIFNKINSGLIQSEFISEYFNNILNSIYEYDNHKNNYNNNHIRKNSSMDNKIKFYNNRYSLNKNKFENNKIQEEKEDEEYYNNYYNKKNNYMTFNIFCNSYDPYYLNDKINNNFSHNFFNFKKNSGDIKFKLMSSKLI